MSYKVRRTGYLLFALFLTVLIFYHEAATFSGALFHYDLIGHNIPPRAWFFEQIGQGHFPLWCPDVCCGFPIFAEGQLGPLYPLNLLFTLFPSWIALNLSVVIHALLAVFGAFFYFRKSHSPFASAIGAIAYCFSSYLVFHVVHLMLFQSAALLPWIFLFFNRFTNKGRIADLLATGIILALMFTTGQQQGAVYGVIGFGIYVFALSFESLLEGNKKGTSIVAGAGVVACLVAFAIVSVIVFQMLELITHSIRQATMDSAFLYNQSILPEMLVRLASPAHHGRTMDSSWWLGNYFEKEIAIYLGLAAWLFTPLALLGKTKRRDRAHLVVSCVAFLVILGSAGPFDGLFEQLPVLNKMRNPSRFVLLMQFSLAFLAASGIDKLYSNPFNRKRAMIALLAGFSLWCAVSWGGAYAIYGKGILYGPYPEIAKAPAWVARQSLLHKDLLLRTTLAALLALAGIGLIQARDKKRVYGSIALMTIGVLVFADLLLAGRKENPVTTPEIYGAYDTTEFLKKNLEGERIFSMDYSVLYGHPGWSLDTEKYRYSIEGLPNTTPLLYQISTANCEFSLTFARNSRVYKSLNTQWIRQLGVKYILSRKMIGPEVAYNTGRVMIFEVPEPAKKYALAQKVIGKPDDESVFEAINQGGAKIDTAFVEGLSTSQLPVSSNGSIEIVKDTPDQRELLIDTKEDAYLIVRESFHPGWRASVDDRESEIYRTNYLFFGIKIPAGRKHVHLEFRPDGFWWQLSLGLVAFFTILVLVALYKPFRKERDGWFGEEEDSKASGTMLKIVLAIFLLLLLAGIVRHPEIWKLAQRTISSLIASC